MNKPIFFVCSCGPAHDRELPGGVVAPGPGGRRGRSSFHQARHVSRRGQEGPAGRGEHRSQGENGQGAAGPGQPAVLNFTSSPRNSRSSLKAWKKCRSNQPERAAAGLRLRLHRRSQGRHPDQLPRRRRRRSGARSPVQTAASSRPRDIKTDPKTDLAIVRIEAKAGCRSWSSATATRWRSATACWPSGTPFGLAGSVTHGIISARAAACA